MGFMEKLTGKEPLRGGGDEKASKPSKGSKKTNDISDVFQESVRDVVLDDFKETGLECTHDGETAYLGMFLDTTDIGGFGRKARKDADKGSIIECINSGRIKVLATDELLKDGALIFIPLASSLENMEEFSLLTDAPYELVFVNEECDFDFSDDDAKISFAEMVQAIEDGESADEILESCGVAPEDSPESIARKEDIASQAISDFEDVDDAYLDEDDEEFEDDEFDNEIPDPDATTEIPPIKLKEDGESEVDDDSYDDDEPIDFAAAEDGAIPPVAVPVTNEVPAVDEFPDEEMYDGDDASEYMSADEMDTEIDDAVVDETLRRRFFSDDLQLEVTTEAFDAQFMNNEAYVPFDENRGEGWLNEYLNQLSRDANVELKRVHNANLMRMRERYFSLLSMHAEQISRDLDITEGSETSFAADRTAIEEARNEAMDDADKRIAGERTRINEAWDAAIKDAGLSAARAAEQQYQERYGRQHDDELRRAETMVRENIVSMFDDQMRELQDSRRAIASRRMDYGVTETLHECSVMYMEMLKGEQELYKRFRASINNFLDENRKDDIARTKALADNLAQTNKADAVTAEYTEKIRVMQAEFDTKRQELAAEIDRLTSAHNDTMKSINEANESTVAKLKAQLDEANAKLDSMRDDYASLDTRKENAFKARMDELADERDAWRDKAADADKHGRRQSLISAGMAIIAVVAALSIGTIVGMNLNMDKVADDTTAQITAEYEKRIDALEQEALDARAEAKAAKTSASSSAAVTSTTVTETDVVDEVVE